MRQVTRLDAAGITEVARKIVIGEYLIAQDDPDWQAALSLVASAFIDLDDVGIIVVPLSDHQRCRWLNGRVPSPVLSARAINKHDLPALQAKVDEMQGVLYPETEEGT